MSSSGRRSGVTILSHCPPASKQASSGAGIREHRAKTVILDIASVPIVDSGVADHLDKTIQAARLKGAHTIVTAISDAVTETIVDLGIDWSGIETLADLQTGLVVALSSLGINGP